MTIETLEYYILHYGYITIFLSLVLGLVGLPIPDEVLMSVIGFYTKEGYLTFSKALMVAIFGTLFGMTLSYYIGKFIGDKALGGILKWAGVKKNKLEKVEIWMNKYGFLTIIMGFFIPGFRHMTFYFCGMTNYPLKKYLSIGLISAFLWTLFYLSIGRFIGIIH
ncbi:DedA family protein [Vagococcus intermedius]|uniref:DedA family protein n=1 Tax=Vagococcus intermedius TaxID=2991418 RepID=A0AAF0I862_9ENTE|nr:DedA family protein [Vagococcus intermedius]WEG74055.1 DedA family protein [Vagococcus intermedius]WEG76135.1 DedA family protein [Vagococcus intermedius]